MSNAGQQPAHEEDLPGKAIMPLLSWRRHFFKSFFIMIAFAGAGVALALEKGVPTYYSEAVLHINFRFAPNLSTDNEIEVHSINQYTVLVNQQTRTVVRGDIVSKAIDDLGEDKHLWLEGESEEKAIRRLQGALQVWGVDDTYLMVVGLSLENPDLIPRLVNSVVRHYVEAHKEEQFFGLDIRMANLTTRRAEIENTIDAQTRKLMSLAERLGLTTFEEKFMNPYDKILVEMNEALASAWEERVTAEAELDAIDAKHEKLRDIELMSAAREVVAGDRALGDLRTYLYQRRSELLQDLSGLKSDHVGRRMAESELEEIDGELDAATRNALEGTREILEEKREAKIAEESAAAQSKVIQTRQIENALAKEVERRKAEVAEFVKTYNEALEIHREVERLRNRVNVLSDRIDSLDLEQSAPGFVRVVSWAKTPEEPSGGGRKQIAVVFAGAGFFIALLLPIVLDFVNRSIRTPRDLHRLLGFAPMSWLPTRGKKNSEALYRDQLMRMALSIMRDVRDNGQGRTYTVTSIDPGDGKTFVTLALADALKQLGLATVAVECDADNESEPFSVGQKRRQQGLTQVLDQGADLDDALIPGDDERADRLPFGNREQRALITNATRLRQFVEQISHPFEVVLIDAPPLLLSAQAEIIAGTTYGTILVVAAERTRGGPLKRALKILERAAPQVVGAVLNFTPIFKGGGYYARLAGNVIQPEGAEPDPSARRSGGRAKRARSS